MKREIELKEFARQKAKVIGQELMDDNNLPGDLVCAQSKSRFEFNGNEFIITVIAFWEKSIHVDFSVVCHGYIDDYSEMGVEF